MINITKLERGEPIVSLIDIPGMGVSKGDHLQVIEKGHSRWDNALYVDVQTKDGYKIEIMFNYRDFDHLPLT